MVRTKFLYAALALVLLAAPSCTDWLDLKPEEGRVEDDYWYSKDDVHKAVIGCYTSLMTPAMITKIFDWGEARADMLTAGPNQESYHVNIIRGEFGPENGVTDWAVFYTTINYCNKVIENAAAVRDIDKTFTDALCRQYVAEATVIRSLMYFYLVRSFHDVPFVLQASNNDQQNYYYAKTDGRIILDSLIAQLERVRMQLPATFGSNNADKGRFTLYGASALLADVYLWQERNADCARVCENIISSERYNMVPVVREMKLIRNKADEIKDTAYIVSSEVMDRWFNELYGTGNSRESIFEIQFPETHPTWGDPFYDMFSSAANRPRRLPKDENLDGLLFPDYEFEGVVDRTIKDIRSLTYSRYVAKYTQKSLSNTVERLPREYPHLIIYRLPDVMLMRAEALTAMAADNSALLQEAYELVKKVRERSNAITTKGSEADIQNLSVKSLERLILAERAREFLFEGKRWYDVLRFAKRDNYGGDNLDYLTTMAIYSAPPEKVKSLQTKYETKTETYPYYWYHYWPILAGTVEMNKNLEQNEYFKLQQ